MQISKGGETMRNYAFASFIAVILFASLFTPLLGVPAHGAEEKTNVYHWEFNGVHYFLNLHITNGKRGANATRVGDSWEINMYVPNADYQYYKVYPGAYRFAFNVSYLSYFMTIHDPDIIALSNALNNVSEKMGFDPLTELNFLLSFVQVGMGYYTDLNTTGFTDYYKFPLETIVEGGGDCEDTSLLMYTISYILGYNVILVTMNVTMNGRVMGHVAVGADVSGIAYGPYARYLKDGFFHNGKIYYYMETTTNESRGLGFVLYYHVGTSPEEAGFYLSNIKFVNYTGYVYSGYKPNDRNVVMLSSSISFPWFIVAIIIVLGAYIPLLILCVRNDKMLCPNCGIEIDEDYEYCPNCGFWLKFNEPPPIEPARSEKY